MRGAFIGAAAIVLALPVSASAHRLDEYLQAARVSLERTDVFLEIDLTPGASVADDIIALIDRDNDDRISPHEARAYAERVLADVVVELDGRLVAMTLERVEAPSTGEMRHGMGAVQLRAVGNVQAAAIWRRQRQLHFTNNHHAASSVYLVNALLPTDAGVSVVSQTRDAKQREARIEYTVTPQWAGYVYGPLVGLVVGGWWLKARAKPNARR
ncbi:MAG TPA: hypothetical protein VFO48_11350 [Vicinamibacterales bacterium]|nr:hypothetical protein [Vicinamibacterales bacterium]